MEELKQYVDGAVTDIKNIANEIAANADNALTVAALTDKLRTVADTLDTAMQIAIDDQD